MIAMGMRPFIGQEAFVVKVENLAELSEVWQENRRLTVLKVNTETRRVLVRPHMGHHKPEPFWVNESEILSRPLRLVDAVFKNACEAAIVGRADLEWKPTKKCEPTSALPGSAAKVQVLIGRVARGEELWHEQDAIGLE